MAQATSTSARALPSPSKPMHKTSGRLWTAGCSTSPDKENQYPLESSLFWKIDDQSSENTLATQAPALALSSPCKNNLRPFSPRKQALQNQSISLSPKRIKQPPRAWERRPATPYVPRNDSQKIWKRIPLQDLGIDTSVEHRENRKQKESRQDYIRAVKRMKVGPMPIEAIGKTNMNSSGRTDVGFFCTKSEEESIDSAISLKKKARNDATRQPFDNGQPRDLYQQPRQDTAEQNEQAEQAEHGEPTISKRDVVELDKLSSRTPSPTTATREPSGDSAYPADYPVDVSVSYALAEEENGFVTDQDTVNVDEAGYENKDTMAYDAASTSGTAELEQDGKVAVMSFATSQATHNEHGMVSAEAVQVPPDEEDTLQIHGDASENSSAAARALLGRTEEGSPIRANSNDSFTTQSSSTAFATEINHVITPALGDADLFDLSVSTAPATSNSGSLYMSVGGSPTTLPASLALSEEPITSTSTQATAPKTVTIVQASEQEEDTAFLADFLLRAKASKAARSAAIQEPCHNQHESEGTKMAMDDPLAEDDIEDSESKPTLVISSLEQPIEVTMSSPLRRSNRNNTNRIPRPHTLPLVPQFGPILPSQNIPLPNTIQLKRATGNEFIFTAKPQQTVQMMTRTNTKKNQGNAVHVDVRLQQLKMDPASQGQDGVREQDLSQGSPLPGPATSPGKKRKRVKADDNGTIKRARKNVKWQEQLASYREATPVEECMLTPGNMTSDTFDAQSDAARPVLDDVAVPIASVVSATDVDNGPTPNSQHEREGEAAKVKVRRLRKVNVGTVNGTPAPKTRTRAQIPTPTHTTSQFDSVASSVLRPRTNSTTCSAIPLPLSTVSKHIDQSARRVTLTTGADTARGPHSSGRAVRSGSTTSSQSTVSTERASEVRRKVRARG